MIFADLYADVSTDALDAFVDAQRLGRLVSVGADGVPHVGLYPFVRKGDTIELHLNRADEQVADLRARPACAFEIDEALSAIPSHWLHEADAIFATAYHRTAIFEGHAAVCDDPALLAAQQVRLLARYQPEGGFRRPAADDPLYARNLRRLASVCIRVARTRIKFKLGQNRTPEQRAEVARRLRERAGPGDVRTAEALESI